MPEESNATEELWYDLVDGLNEIREDLKGNRRGLRHLKSLEQTVKLIDQLIRQIAATKKKRVW